MRRCTLTSSSESPLSSFEKILLSDTPKFRGDYPQAELEHLSAQALERDLDASETQRLLDLDSYLEAILGAQFAIERHVKVRALEPFDRLIGRTEELIERIKNELGEPEERGGS